MIFNVIVVLKKIYPLKYVKEIIYDQQKISKQFEQTLNHNNH